MLAVAIDSPRFVRAVLCNGLPLQSLVELICFRCGGSVFITDETLQDIYCQIFASCDSSPVFVCERCNAHDDPRAG